MHLPVRFLILYSFRYVSDRTMVAVCGLALSILPRLGAKANGAGSNPLSRVSAQNNLLKIPIPQTLYFLAQELLWPRCYREVYPLIINAILLWPGITLSRTFNCSAVVHKSSSHTPTRTLRRTHTRARRQLI